jgi:hypothetical protein
MCELITHLKFVMLCFVNSTPCLCYEGDTRYGDRSKKKLCLLGVGRSTIFFIWMYIHDDFY